GVPPAGWPAEEALQAAACPGGAVWALRAAGRPGVAGGTSRGGAAGGCRLERALRGGGRALGVGGGGAGVVGGGAVLGVWAVLAGGAPPAAGAGPRWLLRGVWLVGARSAARVAVPLARPRPAQPPRQQRRPRRSRARERGGHSRRHAGVRLASSGTAPAG